MDELKTIIGSLCKSDYLPEWILELKDNEVLFSPKRNIKPCIKVDDNHVRTNVWQGLILLETYCRRGFDNKEVDDFIVSLINKSIEIYENDSNLDPYSRLDSSNAILQDLLDIILEKSFFIDNVKFVSFVHVCLNSALFWPFSLAYDFFEHKDVLANANPSIVFDAYRCLIDFSKKKKDYDKYLTIPEIILKNATNYYNHAKNKILKMDSDFYDMGAFYEYDQSYIREDEVVCFDWLKISCCSVDEKVLKKDVEAFIKSDNELLNKIGLCLITLNFHKLSELFIENATLFFNRQSFYADLRYLIVSLSPDYVQKNLTRFKKLLSQATFGLDNKDSIKNFRNHLFGLLNCKGADFPYRKETNEQLITIRNFNKKVYPIDRDPSDDINALIQKIGDKEIDEAELLYKKIIGGSHYFDHIVNEAFSKYLIARYSEECTKYLDRFGYNFSISFVNFLSRDEEHKNYKVLYQSIKRIVDLMTVNSEYRKALHVVLYLLTTISESVDIGELATIYSMIDFEWLTIEEYDSFDGVINTCINETIHSYLEMGLWICEKGFFDVKLIRQAIRHFINLYDYAKLKSIMAFIYPRFLAIDKEYAFSLEDYIFANEKEGKNLSYPLLSISRHSSDLMLNRIASRDDFLRYFKNNSEDHDSKMSQKVFGSWFVQAYVAKGYHEEIVELIFKYDKYDVLLENLRMVNHWLSSKQLNDEQIDRYSNYLLNFYNSLSSNISSCREIDQIIREVSESMVLMDFKDDTAWNLLFGLFKYFRHFLSDESVKLIRTYKDSHVEKVSKLLDMYFYKYDRYQTYEPTLLEVFGVVKNDVNYMEKVRFWRAYLVDKNIELRKKLA